ncbi:MAG: putative signal-transduction protein with domain [Clostridia bacterium]|jgi:CBS domain-containing protein/biotin operon repressor|nr:putative signal-transduction protein with domain [Clostridia bacterium]
MTYQILDGQVIIIEFTSRQRLIIDLVKKNQPITSSQLAERLNVSRAAIRPDLSVLTMSGVLEAKPKMGYFYKSSAIFDVIKSIKVKDIKSQPVIVSEDTTVYDTIIRLFLEDTGTIYVENNGFLSGVVSRKDFIKIAVGNTEVKKLPVGMIMSRMPKIIFTTDEESVLEAAEKIILQEIDSIPVVEVIKGTDGKQELKVTGKVSKTTLTKLLYELGTGMRVLNENG